ncbi:uncharacterized protein LOC122544384 [Chiloscyllium plagiosum]|uniref:uncharacterized protein LOC122544384 n=1 Tax=Chiloscyllium plagiosum TaxID=36176 RepID=UPI001CB7E830|nr:uncharacterized protein LOC122544384 [Chiloscyllium plagiosum]
MIVNRVGFGGCGISAAHSEHLYAASQSDLCRYRGDTMGLARVLSACLLLSTISDAAELTCEGRSRRDPLTVRGRLGDGVLLPCAFAWRGRSPGRHMVVWQLDSGGVRGQGERLVYGWDSEGPGDTEERGDRFTHRTSMRRRWFTTGDAGLSIGGLSQGDEGTYRCWVTTLRPHRRKLCSEVTLTVQPALAPGGDWHFVPAGLVDPGTQLMSQVRISPQPSLNSIGNRNLQLRVKTLITNPSLIIGWGETRPVQPCHSGLHVTPDPLCGPLIALQGS